MSKPKNLAIHEFLTGKGYRFEGNQPTSMYRLHPYSVYKLPDGQGVTVESSGNWRAYSKTGGLLNSSVKGLFTLESHLRNT